MWSAAILAGGEATRFGGRDKSALVVEGRTILDRQLAELTPLTTDILIVGGRESPPSPAKLGADIVPKCGPLGGLHAALIASHGAATIVIAGDMPDWSAAFLHYLLLI